ncbi:hypothetical protein [[Mycoplasma] testudinis]|uniref:hypothetical protein n=1 Tax=[Mycoplasma] testudinis TaxID=33924 RepID=UPI000486E017|nr:hypothetical protein [[Mycoplasma] testudinis]
MLTWSLNKLSFKHLFKNKKDNYFSNKDVNPNLQKNKEQDAKVNGIIMYIILFLGYFVFIMSWSGTLYVQGVNTPFDPRSQGFLISSVNAIHPATNNGIQSGFNSGLIYQIFPNGVSLTLSRATNWSITMGRGVGAIFFGWLISKINHKYVVMVAFGFMVASFPYLFTPFAIHYDRNGNVLNGNAVYGMFILFRILLAFGGSTMISCANGVIGTYYRKKISVFASLNVFSVNTASAVVSIFLLSPIITLAIGLNWQIFNGVIQIAILLLLLIYAYYGKKIDLTTKIIKAELDWSHKNFRQESQNAFVVILHHKETYFFLLAALFLSYITVEPSSNILVNFWTYSPNNINDRANLSWVFGAFNIAFLGGVFTGFFTVAKWQKTHYSLTRFTSLMFFCGTLFVAFGVAIGYHGLDAVHIIFLLIFTFLGSTMLFGVRGNFYSIPYRWGFTRRQSTALISLMFGFSYGGYTILDVITSSVMDAGIKAIQNSYPNEITVGAGAGAIPAVALMFLFPLIAVFAIAFIPREQTATKFSFKDFYNCYLKKFRTESN